MYPVLFKLGDVEIYAFAVMMLVAMTVGFGLTIVTALRLKLLVGAVLTAATLFLLGLFFGARLGFALEAGEPMGSSFINGGVVLGPGLLLGAVLVFPAAALFKQHVGAVFDALAPALLASLGVGRLGCFFAGCCHGKPSDLPWAMHFANLPPEFAGRGAHPTQLYLFLGLGASAAVAFALLGQLRFRGQLALGALAVLCAVTVAEKFFRYTPGPLPRWPVAVWGAVLLVALVLVFALGARRTEPEQARRDLTG